MRFRWFVILLVLLTLAVTLLVSGTGLYLYRVSVIEEDIQRRTERTALNLAERTEAMLAGVEQSLFVLTHSLDSFWFGEFPEYIVATMKNQTWIKTLYVLDRDGKTTAVWTAGSDNPVHPDVIGIDFAYTPLYRKIQSSDGLVWSDKFISTLSANTFVGVGYRAGNRTAIAEIEFSTVLDAVNTASNAGSSIWLIDGRGEVIVDTDHEHSAGILNIGNEPVVQNAMADKPLPKRVRLLGDNYYPAAARSDKLGWLFIVGVPAGLQNAEIRAVVTNILLLSVSFFLIALLLSPFWSKTITAQFDSLRDLAERIAKGEPDSNRREGIVDEFNDLADHLQNMSLQIQERETALKNLNQELEQRVADRTQELRVSNEELRESLDDNIRMRDLLVDTEKLAALGRLVAGVAHEMNTPIGNAIMAVSTMNDRRITLNRKMEDGLRKSDLTAFMAQTAQGLEIAQRNLERAAELVTSFKHVSRDQTSSLRRSFDLREMVDEVLLTLLPTLKRSRHALKTEIPPGIVMDSFPGIIGQIVTNLVSNALIHAWDEGQSGQITISTEEKNDRIDLTIEDDGKGIPADQRKKIFEPFYTTKLGKGGSGLGLNIAHNGAANVLGGSLTVESEVGSGTKFVLSMPKNAPFLHAANEYNMPAAGKAAPEG